LFRFGFKPVGGRTRTEADTTNISCSACAGDADTSDVSAPTGSVSATITGNETEESSSIISSTISQRCLHTSDPLRIVRDPARPPALSVDEEIKLGPV